MLTNIALMAFLLAQSTTGQVVIDATDPATSHSTIGAAGGVVDRYSPPAALLPLRITLKSCELLGKKLSVKMEIVNVGRVDQELPLSMDQALVHSKTSTGRRTSFISLSEDTSSSRAATQGGVVLFSSREYKSSQVTIVPGAILTVALITDDHNFRPKADVKTKVFFQENAIRDGVYMRSGPTASVASSNSLVMKAGQCTITEN